MFTDIESVEAARHINRFRRSPDDYPTNPPPERENPPAPLGFVERVLVAALKTTC